MQRKDFPIFDEKNIVYLDSAASTQKPHAVLKAVDDFYRSHYANVHRGIYPLSEDATELYEGARAKVAGFINASAEEVIFTKNTTEAVNLVAYSLFKRIIRAGDTVLASIMEHHSNFVPWQQLARNNDVRFRVLPVSGDGVLDLSVLRRALKKGVKLLAVTHVSNVLGTVNPIKEMTSLAHRYGALVLVDGAQALAHLPVDVRDLDVDFYAFSGHKVYGPSGIGVLFGKREILEKMQPFLYGGEMIQDVHLTETSFNELPYKFEAGTPPVAEAVGLSAALEYINSIGYIRIRAHEQALVKEAFYRLKSMPGVEIIGPAPPDRVGVVAFNLDGVHPHDVAGFLGSEGICIRAGLHCAQPLHEFLGLQATARISFGVYNEPGDLRLFGDRLAEVSKIFSKAA